jgi:hypothetical protein
LVTDHNASGLSTSIGSDDDNDIELSKEIGVRDVTGRGDRYV